MGEAARMHLLKEVERSKVGLVVLIKNFIGLLTCVSYDRLVFQWGDRDLEEARKGGTIT